MRQILVLAVVILWVALGSVSLGAQDVAILDSANTRNFFALHYPTCNPAGGSYYLGAEEYQRYFRGWEHVLKTAGISHEIIQDSDITLTRLSGYKVLILSNTASLSDEQTKAISQWVIRGGRLLATFGSGYKEIAADPRQDDGLKLQKGGTSGLHQLWHDPLGKLFSSMWVDPNGLDIRITQYAGPTACLQGSLTGDVLHYGAFGNMLIQRPLQFQNALGFLMVENWTRPAPAILVSTIGRGLVVYYAFAPEYLVSKEFGLPPQPSCPDGQVWAGRSAEARALMLCTVHYLLNN